MIYKKFKFVNDFKYHNQTLPKGTEIAIVNDIIYVNGGQITPAYYNVFYDVIQDELNNNSHELIKEVAIPYNKA